jgi:hypothetical protein
MDGNNDLEVGLSIEGLVVIDGNNDLEVGLSIEGLMVIDGNNDLEVGFSIEGLMVIDVSNNLEVGLTIEEPYKKGLPIRALPNCQNILHIVCCLHDDDGPCYIILEE